MRIKRTKNLLYIFSSIMVLGLALISFDSLGLGPAKQTGQVSVSDPTKKPEKNQSPKHTATPTPANTPTPTPTPSLAQLNAAVEIQPATDDIGLGLVAVISNHLNEYYAAEELQVKKIDNITCYYKPGLADINYFVYASYDIIYEGSNVPVPTLKEYLISIDEEQNLSVLTSSDDTDVQEALLLSRASASVAELYIKELIRCYMNAKLAVDNELLGSLVTNPSYLDFEKIRKTTEYIEEYQNPEYLIDHCSDVIPEFDYIVYVAFSSKIVNIKTSAPGMDEFLIKIDDNNYPRVFLGEISPESQECRMELRMKEEYSAFYKTKVEEPLIEAMLSDSNLRDFIERLYLNEENTEN